MKDGFVKVAALTPKIRVADCVYNTERICERIDEAYRHGAAVLVFPELCITGYTCADLFWQETLLLAAKESLRQIMEDTKGKRLLVFVGLPWEKDGKLYHVAAAICDGRLSQKDVQKSTGWTHLAVRFRLACSCCFAAGRFRSLRWQRSCARICGHRIRQASDTRLQGRRCLSIYLRVMRRPERARTERA